MKKTLLLITLFGTGILTAQTPEVTTLKRFMSLGEKQGFKIIIPNQEVNKMEKIQNSYLKSLNASSVKTPKGSTEYVFEKLYLKGNDEPLLMFNSMIQEGKNVGLTSFFFKKDSTSIDSSESMKELLRSLYKKSMLALYEDSIHDHSKMIDKAESELKSLLKGREKADNIIAKSKSKIGEEQKNIEKSNGIISSLTSNTADLNAKKTEATSKLNEIKNSESLVNDAEKELNSLTDKYKKMTSSLKDLQKDPALNANLIIAQNTDMVNIQSMITEKQAKFKTMQSDFKSNLKTAEKNLDNISSSLKDSDKKIKCENQNIDKATKNTNNYNNDIKDNEKVIEKFESTEKKKKQDEIDALNKKLGELKDFQKLYQ